jgi:DNA-directed RNA polymerase subunit omega
MVKKALEKVGNPNVFVNIVSRRVRQLNAGGGGASRPLVNVSPGMGVADTAIREILEDKVGWEFLEPQPAPEPAPKRRKRS